MASDDDLITAGRAARQALADLDRLQQREADAGNAELRATLTAISGRKAGQAQRWLARWQGAEHGPDAPLPVTSESSLDNDPANADAALTTPMEPGNPGTNGGDSQATPEAAPVLDRRDVTPELMILRVARPAGFTFSPGQSVKVGLGDMRRSYSLVSAPHEPFLEFFVELVPGGRMSERLRQLAVGQPISLGAAKGGLRFDKGVTNHLMIATVTGINPFISMVRDYLQQGLSGHRILVMHGASYQDEFGYRQELETLAAAHPEVLSYLPTVSRPDEPRNQSWQGRTGRVDTLVQEILEQQGYDPQDTRVYACGHSGMLESVAGQVQPRGFRLETESYD